MGVRLDHHVALRVADIERSMRFYEQALGAQVATVPTLRSGLYYDQLFGPDTVVKISYLLCDAGAIELFEFVGPENRPIPPSDQRGDGQMHFGVIVDDVVEALRRVETAGGRARLAINHMGGLEDAPRFVYCEDIDGHVFELMEADAKETVRQILRFNPAATPPAAT
jgi:catechol 2,3-dioxygenase-like lactoylglutathione lyase family enzyme